MLSFPNAKINIGLDILKKRPDGYHDLESVMYPVPLNDMLEVVRSDELKFSSSGLEIPGSKDDNLCLKAWKLMKRKFNIPSVHIHLHKVIPMGAGLGGGSSDAAFCLKTLSELYQLEVSEKDLEILAAHLGSDCPFFIRNQPAFVRGTGTELEGIDLELSDYHLLLVMPDIHVATSAAYSGIVPTPTETSLLERIARPIADWRSSIHNQFELTVFKTNDAFDQIKSSLYAAGALYASMSGSGAALYGLFEEPVEYHSMYNHRWFQL